MNMNTVEIQIQNTLLFPKNQGAHAYQLTGIAAHCDWVLLTDGAGIQTDICTIGQEQTLTYMKLTKINKVLLINFNVTRLVDEIIDLSFRYRFTIE